VKTTSYFESKVRRERPEITDELCLKVLGQPSETQVQPDGRTRHWRKLEELGGRYVRVVTLEDGETVHNAFIDRTYARRKR
jgi:hypothetical protein